MTAATHLKVLIVDCNRLRAETRDLRAAASRVKARCQELYTYLSNSFDALINYGRRHRNGLAVSSSRAEGCVDDIGNTRMRKRRRMRWSPKRCASRRRHRISRPRRKTLRLAVSSLTTTFCPLPNFPRGHANRVHKRCRRSLEHFAACRQPDDQTYGKRASY